MKIAMPLNSNANVASPVDELRPHIDGLLTSVGIVFASTFAAFVGIPVLFLLHLAFIVSFGVLLDTVSVRTLLIPALRFELGRSLWWSSRKIHA